VGGGLTKNCFPPPTERQKIIFVNVKLSGRCFFSPDSPHANVGPTITTVPSSRVSQWGLKACDTLKFCPYRLERYISQEKGMVFCVDSKNSTVKSVTLYSRIYCETLRQFNASVSQKNAASLQEFFKDEKFASDKAEELKEGGQCPFIIFEPWVTYFLTEKSI